MWVKLSCSYPYDPAVLGMGPEGRMTFPFLLILAKQHGVRGSIPAKYGTAEHVGWLTGAGTEFAGRGIGQCVAAGIVTRDEDLLRPVGWDEWNPVDATAAGRQRQHREVQPPLIPSPTGTDANGRMDGLIPLHGIPECLRGSPFLAQPGVDWALWYEEKVVAFPRIDVAHEIVRAHEWCRDNPTRAPRADFRRFMGRWLARADGDVERDHHQGRIPWEEWGTPPPDPGGR